MREMHARDVETGTLLLSDCRLEDILNVAKLFLSAWKNIRAVVDVERGPGLGEVVCSWLRLFGSRSLWWHFSIIIFESTICFILLQSRV